MSETDPRRDYRWNYLMWVVETSLWMLSTALIDSTTVLPVLILSLSHSPLLVSLVVSLRYAGQGWPQLFAASLVSGKPYKRPFYLRLVVPGRLLLLWPVLLLLTGTASSHAMVTAILIAYFAFWVSEGLSIVPWTEMVGKTIPPSRRGRMFAAMHVIGGLLGIVAGIVIGPFLEHRPFPYGYGILFAAATVGYAISTTALGLLREPPAHHAEERYSTLALIKDIPNLFRAMPQFRLLVILQALFGFAVLPSPFYILYASSLLAQVGRRGIGEEALGVGGFLAVQTAGLVIGNALWGFISDRYGNRVLLRVLACTHVIVPLSAILAGYIGHHVNHGWAIFLVFLPTFFAFGGLTGGTWMGVTNFLLELAPEYDRPAYIAITNALNIPAIVLPLLGGIFVSYVGYNAIFLIAAVALGYALFLTSHLKEPRQMLTHEHHPPPEEWE